MPLSARGLTIAVVVLVVIATLGAIFGGPPLGDHEAIVAECARNMRLSGDWLVPQFLDTPFIRKPPLAYWLVAGASYLFPNDSYTHLPVTETIARLPSALAALGTVLLLWRLGAAMFGRRTGIVTAVIAASSVCFMLFAPNATVEMILTFCCTWAYLHFWFAINSLQPSRRRLHMFFFYVALGLGMLAKGPAPMALVAVPLALWWYTHESLEILATEGWVAVGKAAVVFVRGILSQTIAAFTQLWLLPGLIVFAMMFVPWIFAVAAKHEHAWNLWNWQYVQRAEGDYLDSRPRGLFYYLPMVVGFTAPWLFALPEALASPWMKRYAHVHRPLLFCGLWALIGIAVMSLEPFKKPYYILPAIPALILMMAVAAERFYAHPPLWLRLSWKIWVVAAAASVAGLIFAFQKIHQEAPLVATRIMPIAAAAVIALLAAGIFYIRGQGWLALGVTATAAVAAFHAVWYTSAPILADLDNVRQLASVLDAAKVPADAKVVWADQRPDARLGFYFGRQTRYMVPPAEIVAEMVDRTKSKGKNQLMMMVMHRAETLLKSPQPVYIILAREHYDFMNADMTGRAFLIDSIHAPSDEARKDWMIVSNVERTTQPR